MAKYKLIKSYPGNNDLGKVIDLGFSDGSFNPSDYPEFWEKIEEPTFEILSFVRKDNDDDIIWLVSENKDYLFCNVNKTGIVINPFSFEDVEKNSSYLINSVKRLSDGEIFTIGDKFTFNGLFGDNPRHKYDVIKGFDFRVTGEIGVLYNNGLVDLKKIRKVKLILTTKDGVDTYGGEEVWLVFLPEANCFHSTIVREELSNPASYMIYFSSEKLASEYCENMAKKYSIQDIIDSGTYVGPDTLYVSINKLNKR